MSKRIDKIDRVLRKTIRKMDLESKLEGYRIWTLWDEIVGEQIAGRAQPDRLRNRILFIRVSSSTWMQQLQILKPTLLEKIHQTVKGGVIKDIRFLLGEVNRPPQPSPRPQTENRSKTTGLTGEIEPHLKQVKDAELRSLMRNIMLKQAGKLMARDED